MMGIGLEPHPNSENKALVQTMIMASQKRGNLGQKKVFCKVLQLITSP